VKPHKAGLQKCVIIHGYGGGGAVFSKMMKHMQNHYEVITMDLLGMGNSGRPLFDLTEF
jgi:pimeloyl-ACP methyl ester carboxylesterase